MTRQYTPRQVDEETRSLSVKLMLFYITPLPPPFFFFFFFNDTATTEIYTLSLHDALPIYESGRLRAAATGDRRRGAHCGTFIDRKSTRLNSSHSQISYAVFCLKKKKKKKHETT